MRTRYLKPQIWYVQYTNTGLWVFNYEGTQRYPWTWFSYDYFRLYDVLLPNDISIKFLDECGSYCLPEDKETVENMFSNVSWSEESISWRFGYQINSFVPLSKELSRVLTSACDSFLMRDKLFTFEEARCIMDLYQYDDQGIFRREFASVYARGDKFYVFPAECFEYHLGGEGGREKADYTWEDLSSQEIPEEFHDEIMTLYNTYKDTNP